MVQGVRDVIAVDELFDAIPAINRSFHHCKNISTNPSEHGPDFIEFREFRLLLQTLRQFFEYYQAFDRWDEGREVSANDDEYLRVDTGDDDRISKEEFTSDELKEAMEKVKDCDSLTAVSATLWDLQIFCMSHIVYGPYTDCIK